MTHSTLNAGALWAQHGKHIQCGFWCVAIGSDAAMLAAALSDAFATARNTYI